MARLPNVSDLGARPIPSARRSIATVRNAGAVADAAGQFGETAAQAGEQQLQNEDKMEAATARSKWMADKIALESEFENDQDFDTQEKRYGEGVAKLRQEVAGGIKSNRARKMFELETAPDIQRGVAAVQKNVFNGKRDVARAGVFTTLTNNQEALLAAKTEEDRAALLDASNAALSSARASGYITAVEEAEKRVGITMNYAEGRLSLMPEEEQIALLKTSLAADKTGTFTDFVPREKRGQLLAQAESRLRTEQRAQRAEQRLAMQGQVDEWEETLRLANDGVPVPLDALDRARDGAKAAGKDALAYGLGVARVKVALSSEHKADTPTELQDDINTLSARITKAGDKAKPEELIARDHLISMRDKASSALKADPLSWAAGAWGIQVPPLDWDKPDSLGQRMKVARMVSQRTGAPLAFLTDEEAQPLQQKIESGPAGQLEVLAQIKRFGAQGAPAAARQLAPNNDGFRVAAGLATLPSQALARDASRDAIIGADSLKAYPEIFDKAKAQDIYSELAPAMRLLPAEMQAGVFAAATNIYAARMSRENKHEWDKDSWPGAISAALGGGMDRGVKRGGLGTWRGEPTILPYGWSQSDLEATIGRADEASLIKAAGGRAVWADGTPVPTKRLKQLHLVPDGDGTYRVSDGNGYLMREGGGAFRLDVKKLRR